MTQPSNFEPFLQTIRDNPQDDTPRLIFADYLDENDHPIWAELIRTQIAQHHLPEWDAAKQAMQPAIDRCLEQMTWPKPDRLKNALNQFYVMRGMVESVVISLYRYEQLQADIEAWMPIREINLAPGIREDPLEPRGIDLPSRIESIILFEGVAAEEIASGRNWNQLHSFAMNGVRLDRSDTYRIIDEIASTKLKKIAISDVPRLDLDLLTAITSHSLLTELTYLRLRPEPAANYAARIRAMGATLLAESEAIRKLQYLDLSDQAIGDAGIRTLAESPNMQHLEVLELANNDIGSIGYSGMEALAGSRYMNQIRMLNLTGNPIGDWGVRELLKWPNTPQLRNLDLSGCHIKREGSLLILNYPHWHPELQINLILNRIPKDLVPRLYQKFGDRLQISGAF